MSSFTSIYQYHGARLLMISPFAVCKNTNTHKHNNNKKHAHKSVMCSGGSGVGGWGDRNVNKGMVK